MLKINMFGTGKGKSYITVPKKSIGKMISWWMCTTIIFYKMKKKTACTLNHTTSNNV